MNTEDFEIPTFNTFDKEYILLNDSLDPDSNFFNTHGFTNTTYFTPATVKVMIKENNHISFSALYLNIRSLNKNFENVKLKLVERS